MRRRPIDHRLPEGPNKPSAVFIRRRRRRRCLLLSGLALFILLAVAGSALILIRHFEERRVGGNRGGTPDPTHRDGKEEKTLRQDHGENPEIPLTHKRSHSSATTSEAPLLPDRKQEPQQHDAAHTVDEKDPHTPPLATGHDALQAAKEKEEKANGEHNSAIPTATAETPTAATEHRSHTPSTSKEPVPSQTAFQSSLSPNPSLPLLTATTTSSPTLAGPLTDDAASGQAALHETRKSPGSLKEGSRQTPLKTAHARLFPTLRLITGADVTEGDDTGLTLEMLQKDKRVSESQKQHVLVPEAQAAALGLRFDDEKSDTVAPLHKLQVKMYRQRVDRYRWWSPTAQAAANGAEREEERMRRELDIKQHVLYNFHPQEDDIGYASASSTADTDSDRFAVPIVSLIGPSLPVSHYFPQELLVEETFPADDGVNRHPDPSRLVGMRTTVSRRPAAAGTGTTTETDSNRDNELGEEDAEVVFSPAELASPTQPAPLLRLIKKTRHGDDVDNYDDDHYDSVAADEKATPADGEQRSKAPYVTLQWLLPIISSDLTSSSSSAAVAAGTAAPSQQRRKAVDIELYTVRPSRSHTTEGGFDASDLSRTTSLAGTFTFRGLRRLYGLPGAGAQAADDGRRGPSPSSVRHVPDVNDNGGAYRSTFDLGKRFTIPSDGFRYLASVTGKAMDDWTRVPGVLPLIFVELAMPAGARNRRGGPERGPQSRARDGGVGDDADIPAEEVRTVGILWMSSAPFSVRTKTLSRRTKTVRLTLSSSAAETRVFLLPGHTHADVLRQYYTLTGFPVLPPIFALGYHHHFSNAFVENVPTPPVRAPLSSSSSRLGPRGEPHGAANADRDASTGLASTLTLQTALQAASASLLRAGIPTDSIGYTGGDLNQRLTPFSWHRRHMPNPTDLQTNLWLYGRRFFFARASPHIPVIQSSPLYQEGRKHGYFVSTNPDEESWFTTYSREAGRALLFSPPPREGGGGAAAGNGNNEGGPDWSAYRSHVVDFFSPHARRWFGSMLKVKRFTGSTNRTFVALTAAAPDCLMEKWQTLPQSAGHSDGTVHRQVHNAYSAYYTMTAFYGLMRRTKYWRRAFAPVENYFIGVQRFGAAVSLVPASRLLSLSGEQQQQHQPRQHDLDDPHPEWQRLRATIADVVALSMSGLPFVGANTVGFEVDFTARRHAMSPSTASTTTAPTRVDAQGGGENTDETHQQPRDSKRVVAAKDWTPSEKEELLVRWYQAASVFPFMRAEEGRGLPNALDEAEVNRRLTRTNSPPSQRREGERQGKAVEEEDAHLAASVQAVSQALSSQVFPSLLLSSSRAARDAIRMRYALLPYLYTSLWHTSEAGTPLLTSPSFLHASRRRIGNRQQQQQQQQQTARTDSGETDECFAVGAALVACPLTTPTPSASLRGASSAFTTSSTAVQLPDANREGIRSRKGTISGNFSSVSVSSSTSSDPHGGYYYDWYTGKRFAAGARASVPLAEGNDGASSVSVSSVAPVGGALPSQNAPQRHRKQGRPLLWLGEGDDMQKPRDGGAALSRLPLFQRQGTIVPTFTTFSASARRELWSTHVPANVSLTIALPPNLVELAALSRRPLHQQDGAGGSAVMLASGDLYWDEGSENYQVAAPPSTLPPPVAAADGDIEADESEEDRDPVKEREAEVDETDEQAAALKREMAMQRRARRKEARLLSRRYRRAQETLRAGARYCHMRLSCYLADGRLFLSGFPAGWGSEPTPTAALATPSTTSSISQGCLEALERLEASWNEVPIQVQQEALTRRARDEARRHQWLRDLEAAADRGEQRRILDRDLVNATANTIVNDGGAGGKAVLPEGSAVMHSLTTALQLRYVRFLTATAKDAKWLASLFAESSSPFAVMDDRDAAGETELEEKGVEGEASGGAGAVTTTRVIPAVQALGYRAPAPSTFPPHLETSRESVGGRRGFVKPWRLSASLAPAQPAG